MTPPRTIMGTVLLSPWVRDPLKRRGALAVVAVVLAIFCIWPRQYQARAMMMPDDSGGGLASILGGGGGGGALASLGVLLGGHQSIESDLTIARSQIVAQDVAERLGRDGSAEKHQERDAAAIRHKVQIEVIRGSIMEIQATDRDPNAAKALVSNYVLAIRSRLAALNLEVTAQKKAIAVDRMAQATLNLSRAQDALDSFRLANRLAAPEVQLGAAISLVTQLQGKLQAAQAELQTLRQFATSSNVQVQAAQAQIDALTSQIATAQARVAASPGPSVGGMTPKISEYENLYRNEKFAEAEYQIYKSYLDTVTVENLSAGINMDVIEPPFVDPDRQFNPHAVGALLLVLLVGVLAEFYIAQPPVGLSERQAS